MKSDIIVGLQHGDEGKGKVVLEIIKRNKYDYCLRFNGGPNAGHTVYKDGKKIILHQIPCGILYNIKSIIGSGCMIDLNKLKDEIIKIKEIGIDVDSLLKISYNCHIINKLHIQDDIDNNSIGSTCSGMRPVNRDKYDRKGTRICDLDKKYLKQYIGDCEIIDIYNEIDYTNSNVLCEGAQGFELDIDYGKYPYVTSTHCVSGFVNTSSIPIKSICNVYGVCKIYDTYVGKYKFENINENSFKRLRILGEEYGSTTGRDRQVNWLNLTRLRMSIIINSVTDLVINKCDILQKLNIYKLIENNKISEFNTFYEMTKYITTKLKDINLKNIIFSGNKYNL